MKTKSVLPLVVIVICTLVAFSCNKPTQTPLSVEERTNIEDTVKHLVRLVEKGANERDLDISFNIFSDDPDFTFSEDGYIYPPKDSLYKIFKPVYGNWSELSLRWDTMRIVVLDRNSAVFTGAGPWSATDMEGNYMNGQVVATYVFVNRDDKWQMLHGHASHTFE